MPPKDRDQIVKQVVAALSASGDANSIDSAVKDEILAQLKNTSPRGVGKFWCFITSNFDGNNF